METELSVLGCEVRGCTDFELVARLQELTGRSRAVVARLIVYVGEMDERGLFREHAYPSMFQYLVTELKMSEAEAYLRLQAARLARRFPVVIGMLERGDVHLSSLRQISRFLTAENHLEMLERLREKTKSEVERLVVELEPKPDVRASLRKVPHPAPVLQLWKVRLSAA